jgi:hypothetical protein
VESARRVDTLRSAFIQPDDGKLAILLDNGALLAVDLKLK